MPGTGYVIVRDARGALVHVRRRDTGDCVGCIEAGLYALVRAIVEEERTASVGEGIPGPPRETEYVSWR